MDGDSDSGGERRWGGGEWIYIENSRGVQGSKVAREQGGKRIGKKYVPDRSTDPEDVSSAHINFASPLFSHLV